MAGIITEGTLPMGDLITVEGSRLSHFTAGKPQRFEIMELIAYAQNDVEGSS